MIYLIYKIHCNITNEDYYGSTKNLNHRMSCHKSNTEKQKTKRQCVSKQIIKRGDYIVSVVETFDVETKDEALWKERYYIENNSCINIAVPIKTKQEKQNTWKKYKNENQDKLKNMYSEYYKKNSERRKKESSDWYYSNQERVKERRRQTCFCEACGIDINKAHKERHYKTITHLKNLKMNETP